MASLLAVSPKHLSMSGQGNTNISQYCPHFKEVGRRICLREKSTSLFISKSNKNNLIFLFSVVNPKHHNFLPMAWRVDCAGRKSLWSPKQLVEVDYGSPF